MQGFVNTFIYITEFCVMLKEDMCGVISRKLNCTADGAVCGSVGFLAETKRKEVKKRGIWSEQGSI